MSLAKAGNSQVTKSRVAMLTVELKTPNSGHPRPSLLAFASKEGSIKEVMIMLNEVRLIGRLGQKPELFTTQTGTTIVKFSLATTENWTDRNSGQRQEKTEWHRLVLFGKVAEIAAQYLDKGDLAYFSGKLQTQDWEKDGVKRSTTEVVVSDMKMLGGKQQGQQPQQQSYQQQPQQQQQAYQQQPAQQQQAYQQQPQQQPQQQAAFNGSADIPF